MKFWPATAHARRLKLEQDCGCGSSIRCRDRTPVRMDRLTVRAKAAEDGPMSEVTSATPRRSGRVFHRVRIQAQGRTHDRKKFKETCETVVVNAHGGLLLLKHEVSNGEMLVLTNPETLEEQECRIVYLGEPVAKGQRVGVEFLSPAPRFWGVEFLEESSKTDVN